MNTQQNKHNTRLYAAVAAHLLMALGWGNLLFIGLDNTAKNAIISTVALLTGSALAAIQILALLHDFRETTGGLDDPETRW
jgi:hypothetical protein